MRWPGPRIINYTGHRRRPGRKLSSARGRPRPHTTTSRPRLRPTFTGSKRPSTAVVEAPAITVPRTRALRQERRRRLRGLTASDGSEPGIVRLTWDASAGATGFDVTGTGHLWQASVPAYRRTGRPGTHQYTVAARNACGTSAFGPPDRGNAGALPPCAPIPLLTGATWERCATTYSGWVGMNFVVGSNPFQVSALGRVYIAGNSQPHLLRLVHAATGTILASVQWIAEGGIHNRISYAALPSR